MYLQPESWKQLVPLFPDQTLKEWIASKKDTIPKMKKLAGRGPRDWSPRDGQDPLLIAIEREESDLVLYEGELKRRMALK